MINEKLSQSIIELFRSKDTALQLNEISKRLSLRSDSKEYFELKENLEALCEQNVLQKSARRRYSLNAENGAFNLQGEITVGSEKIFVTTNSQEFPIVYIKRNSLNTAFDGDIVQVSINKLKKDNKPYGEVIKVIERGIINITGVIHHDGEVHYLIPDDKRFYVDFLVTTKNLNTAKEGDKVVGRLIKWEDVNRSPYAEIIAILGASGEPIVEYEAILDEFNLPKAFPEAVMTEAHKQRLPTNDEITHRLDLRKELIVTIDPVDARDFDDALSLKILENGNYELGVHIADVSHYVNENSALDIEARMRGNSVYLVDRVIPMLPEDLSNVICSLNPNEDRMAFSCIMELGPKGAVKNYKIAETVINSKRRYSYDEVLEMIENKSGDNIELLLGLHKVAETQRQKRFREGGVDFSTTEVKFILDENKFPVDVKLRKTTKSTSLVEECMLLANKVVAGHIKKISKEKGFAKVLPFIYRIHDNPQADTINNSIEFISKLGIKVTKRKDLTSKDLNDILHSFRGTSEETIVNQIMIRSMPKAVYSNINMGHFGLGFDDYTHFTSPIRRYPDLIVHRLLKEYANTAELDSKRVEYLKMLTKNVSDVSSATERTAMEAERASTKLTHTLMMKNRIGEMHEGTISGVTSFGAFVILDDVYCEGLLHIRDMTDDYYFFDEANFRLVGKRQKKILRIGTRVSVQVAKVNIDKRAIDLVLPDRDVSNYKKRKS